MRTHTSLWLGLLGFFLIACGPSVRPESDDEPCGETETFCGQDADGDDICVDLASDAAHCGACHRECREPEANACFNGMCACIGSNHEIADACDAPTVCVGEIGKCILPDYGTTETCDPIEERPCEDEDKVCAVGFCTIPVCHGPEECNGLDDDCDGHLDATGPLPGQGVPLTRPCYTGPDDTEGNGICSPGVQTCYVGSFTQACQGEQTPVPEDGFLRCDGLDNDCDTCADNVWNDGVCEPLPPLAADIVFIIDRSGSMTGTIAAVVSAVQSWATNIGTNPNIRFALVNPTQRADTDGVAVTLGLSSYVAFNATMGGVTANGADIEPMHYATQLVLGGTLNDELGFTPGSIRIVIAIHDEPATGNGNTVTGVHEATVCGAVPADTILAVITIPDYFPEWDLCTSSTAMPSTAMELTSDAGTMLENLNLIVETPCF